MKRILIPLLLSIATSAASAAESQSADLSPYRGPSNVGVDTMTLTGKVMCGYQGWFNTPDDGMGLGWTHWARNRREPFAPGNVTVDLWPDLSELDSDERFATGFKNADGNPAEVFSSANRKTTLDEGAAIFKCPNDPPVGANVKFLDNEGLPSDFYLRLTGHGGRALRGQIPTTAALPE